MKWLERKTRIDTTRIDRELTDYIANVVTANAPCSTHCEVTALTNGNKLNVHVLITFTMPRCATRDTKTYYVRDDYSTIIDFYDESLLDDNLEQFVFETKRDITTTTVGVLLEIIKDRA